MWASPTLEGAGSAHSSLGCSAVAELLAAPGGIHTKSNSILWKSLRFIKALDFEEILYRFGEYVQVFIELPLWSGHRVLRRPVRMMCPPN